MRLYIQLLCVLLLFAGCKNETPKVDKDSKVESKPESSELNEVYKALQEDSDNLELLEKRGDLLFAQGEFALAAQDFDKVTKTDTTNIKAYHKLADAILNNMDTRTALITIQSAARRFPKDLSTLMMEAKYELILRRFDDCSKTLNKLKKLDPQNAEVFLLVGKLGEETGNLKLAKSGYRTATELDAGLMDAWKKIGDIYALENNPIAIKFYDNGLEVEPNNISLLLGKGTYYFRHKQPQKAIDVFTKVVNLEPSNTLALFDIGLSYIALDNLDKAKENLNICLKTSPSHAPSYYFLGQIAEAQKNKVEAKKLYEQALVFDKDYTRAQNALDNL